MLSGSKNQSKMATVTVPTSITPVPTATKADVNMSAAPPAPAKGNKRMRTKETQAQAESKEKPVPSKDATTLPTETEEKAPETGNYLIVHKAVRQYLKNNVFSMHCGADAIPAINAKVQEFLDDACKRAHGNNRKTLKACDF